MTEGEAATLAARDVPELGQLVEVRRRQFVVSDIDRSVMPPDPLAGETRPPQHLVTLTSVEDDALGEELQVVWEIEPGARPIERGGLPRPDGFDDPRRLQAFLHAVRWGAVTDADHRNLQSPFRSGITLEDYQLDPVVRAIQMPRANLLVADDVGLGKTIEAGLVIQELMLRHRARTTLIVCPSSLTTKWRDEMHDKFGLEFRIVDTQLLKELRRSRGLHVNPWTHFPRLIVSVDWLKRDIPMRMFRDVLPSMPTYPRPFDILIVDEAHNVAPSASGNYAVDSQRTKAIRTLAPHFEHRLFLTATPHNGYPESFSSLLELLDDQRFARGVEPDREQLSKIMVRRLKDEIVDWQGKPKFAKRVLVPIEVEYSDDERKAHALLSEYSSLRSKAAKRAGGGFATDFVLKLLKKRLFSSPAAFAATLERHRARLEGRVAAEERKSAFDKGILKRAIEKVEEDYAVDEEYETALDEAVEAATSEAVELTPREVELLNKMSAWAQRASGRSDSKAEALFAWLEKNLRPGGVWSDQRVIIFTEYRATQVWFANLLAARGFAGEHLMQLYGGMDPEDRDRVKAAFQASPKDADVRILLATDAASEGIDLQSHCSFMIHIEVPWNPNRLEQRNGRIDRHGQRAAEVRIHHFVPTGFQASIARAESRGDLDGDLEFLWVAVTKIEAIRQDLGRVGPVIASQVEDAMLGRRTNLSLDQAEKQAAAARKVLGIEKRLGEQIQRLHERVEDSRRSLDLTPENVELVVSTALDLAGQPSLKLASLPGVDSPVFHMPALKGTWTRCQDGLLHPHTAKRRPITFDNVVIDGRDDVVLAHLEHRLVQMSLRLLRAEVWAPDTYKRLHRVTAMVVPDSTLDTPAVLAWARLVVVGENRHRLHEEIIQAGGTIRSGRFARLGKEQLDGIVERAEWRMPSEAMLEELTEVWPKIEEPLLASIDARKDDRMQYVHNALDRRRGKEVEDMRGILTELERSIRSQLEEPEHMQLELWTSTEKEQLQRNIGALQQRLGRIPAEIENEARVIEARYSSPSDRVFPVAVAFLVPQSMAGGAR